MLLSTARTLNLNTGQKQSKINKYLIVIQNSDSNTLLKTLGEEFMDETIDSSNVDYLYNL